MDDAALQSQLAEIRADIKGLTGGMADLKATIEAGFAQVLAVQGSHSKAVDDHEARLRHLELNVIPQLMTRAESKEKADRASRRFYWIGGGVTTLVVPIVTVIVTKLVGA